MTEETQKELPQSFREELKSLEGRLEERKRALQEQGVPMPEEKEIFGDVLKEHIAQMRPKSHAPIPIPPALTDDLQKKADDIKQKQIREEQVRDVVELALSHGIKNAVHVAESATPWLVDELHDHLKDDYYEELVALKRIKPM